jgi:transcriptional regulator GlxA family with amidase domain
MKHISILVPEGENNLSSIIGTYKILSRANAIWKEKNKKIRYKIELVGTSNQIDFYNGLFSVKPQVSISAIQQTNLIIIPSLNHNYSKAVKENQQMIPWLKAQYKQGAEIASICTGAFMLAATGILDGKTCSTHWSAENTFKNMFPAVKLQTEKLITDEQGIYTNGGAFSFLHLVIYLVEKYFDRPTALYCSKVFQIEMDRHSQSPFIIFSGQKMHHDDMVKKAQTFIENNLGNKISIESLSAKLHVGRRNFDRRFIKATGNTPIEYVQRVKMEAVKKSLETTGKTVHEVMFEVGYSDTKAFREVFKKVTGMSPLEYRNKYNRDAGI